MKRPSYLIEIRLGSLPKKQIRGMTYDVDKRFKLGHTKKRRPVPHVSLAGPLTTNSESRLISDFRDVLERYPIMKYRIDGYGLFRDSRVVFVNITPSLKLNQLRRELSHRIKGYCKLQKFDLEDKFYFHSTIAMKIPKNKFDNICNYIKTKVKLEYTHYLLRVTILKNSKILAEYDFLQRRLLNRRQALSKAVFQKTMDLLRKRQSGELHTPIDSSFEPANFNSHEVKDVKGNSLLSFLRRLFG